MNLNDLKETIKNEAYLESSSSREIFGPIGNPVHWIIDLRAVLLDAQILNIIAEKFWEQYKHLKEVQIAGLELASVSLMTALVIHAHKYGCTANAVIIRKSRKKYGLQNKIEGRLERNRSTIIVDDLINSGDSVEKCFFSLADDGIYPRDIFCVVNFGNPDLQRKLTRKGVQLSALFHLDELELKTAPTTRHSLIQYKNKFVFDPKTDFAKFNIFCRSNPMVGNDLIYYGTDAAELHALHRQSGKLVWTTNAVPNPYKKGIWSSPCFVKENICVGAYDGGLRLLDGTSGALIWSNHYASYIGSSPAYDDSLNCIFIGLEFAFPGRKGAIAAIAAENGEILWSYEVSEYVHSSPIFSKRFQRLFCASNNNELYCLEPASGHLLWRQSTYGTSKMKPCLSGDEKYIYISTNMGVLYCMDTETGHIQWTFSIQFGILVSPLEKNGFLYFGALDGYFYVLNVETGALVTKIRTDGRIFAEASGTPDSVIFGNNSGTMYEISTKDFTIIGRLQLSDRILSKIAYKDGDYIIHLGDDKLMCFERS
jgi:orotate phosphoribosyltransferase